MDHVTTPDGRDLEILLAGDEDGFPLVFHGGSPSAAVPYARRDRAAADAGFRLITSSRPGYGSSTPHADLDAERRVCDDVADTVTILDALGVDEFVTLGWSGGGPRALGCAALLPGRCRAACSLAGVAPYGVDGLDWTDGMDPTNVRDFEAALAGREALAPFLEEQVASMAEETAETIAAAVAGLVDPVDVAAVTGDVADYLARSDRRATLQGMAGLLEDCLVEVRPWGFEVGEIAVPVSVWQGSRDRLVPFGHGTWLAAHVPGARAHLLDDEGHMSILLRLDEVLAELRELAGIR